MSPHFHIEVKKTNGDLYLNPKGIFDGSSACELINLIHEQYDGKGNVVIDTHYLHDICPFGSGTFRRRLNQNLLPPSRIVFKGEKGHAIAPEGSQVHIAPEKKHGCKGGCKNCPCSSNRERS